MRAEFEVGNSCPKVESPTALSGTENVGVLKALKNSERNFRSPGFRNRKDAEEGEVKIARPVGPKGISTGVAKRVRSRIHEGSRIETLRRLLVGLKGGEMPWTRSQSCAMSAELPARTHENRVHPAKGQDVREVESGDAVIERRIVSGSAWSKPSTPYQPSQPTLMFFEQV